MIYFDNDDAMVLEMIVEGVLDRTDLVHWIEDKVMPFDLSLQLLLAVTTKILIKIFPSFASRDGRRRKNGVFIEAFGGILSVSLFPRILNGLHYAFEICLS